LTLLLDPALARGTPRSNINLNGVSIQILAGHHFPRTRPPPLSVFPVLATTNSACLSVCLSLARDTPTTSRAISSLEAPRSAWLLVVVATTTTTTTKKKLCVRALCALAFAIDVLRSRQTRSRPPPSQRRPSREALRQADRQTPSVRLVAGCARSLVQRQPHRETSRPTTTTTNGDECLRRRVPPTTTGSDDDCL
jgi:hypothetical protein